MRVGAGTVDAVIQRIARAEDSGPVECPCHAAVPDTSGPAEPFYCPFGSLSPLWRVVWEPQTHSSVLINSAVPPSSLRACERLPHPTERDLFLVIETLVVALMRDAQQRPRPAWTGLRAVLDHGDEIPTAVITEAHSAIELVWQVALCGGQRAARRPLGTLRQNAATFP